MVALKKENYEAIGQNISKRRRELGITQEKLAEMVNLSASYIGAVERGAKLPKLDTFIRIANALKISSDSLLSDVLGVSNEIAASELSKKIEHLSQFEQRRILNVVQTMIEDVE